MIQVLLVLPDAVGNKCIVLLFILPEFEMLTTGETSNSLLPFVEHPGEAIDLLGTETHFNDSDDGHGGDFVSGQWSVVNSE